MNYIGAKNRLLPFIQESIFRVLGKDLSAVIFCDLFAGTGAVGKHFKPLVKEVIANDLEYYSYVLNRNYIGNNTILDEGKALISKLNDLAGVNGFVSENYTQSGVANRQYFTENNGKKIDAIRKQIDAWKTSDKINDDEFYFLLASLIESADKVANTASVYGAYLKKIKKTAAADFVLHAAQFNDCNNKATVYNSDSNVLIEKIKGDVLYLDPPYNHRQYGANYHLLNTIALYDKFEPRGKTGLRDYNRSDYSIKAKALESFEELIHKARFKYIFLSYNNEGIMSESQIRTTMSKYGKYSLNKKEYQRFKADKDINRNHKATITTEYIHVLEKKDITL